jgi:hypothetical protein
VIVSPGVATLSAPSSSVPLLAIEIVTTCGRSTVTVSSSLAGWSWGPVPSASAVLTTSPASMSAWVMSSVAEQVTVSPGLRTPSKAAGQVTVTDGSVTTTPSRVTLPVLVTRKL